jgi:hypothetical protein
MNYNRLKGCTPQNTCVTRLVHGTDRQRRVNDRYARIIADHYNKKMWANHVDDKDPLENTNALQTSEGVVSQG